jgi:hypothetical protein
MPSLLMPSPSLLAPPAVRSKAPRSPRELSSFLARFGLTIPGLLTSGSANAKLAKGEGLAFSSLLHLLPAKGLARALTPDSHACEVRSELPGLRELAKREGLLERALLFNACAFSSEACRDLCLAFSGHGGLSPAVSSCRARRSLAFLSDREAFIKALLWSAGLSMRKARMLRLPFALRLNGTQELPWHEGFMSARLSREEAKGLSRLYGSTIPHGTLTIPEALESMRGLSLYDYAKAPLPRLLAMRESGIHTTASLAADSPGGALRALQAARAGFAVAVPILLTKGAPLPGELFITAKGGGLARLDCIDGDLNDLRMLDRAPRAGFSGLAVMLRLKRSRGSRPESASRFALAPHERWQDLAGGGLARFSGELFS